MRKKIVANFFWNNNNLSLYDYCCLKSFLKNNFEVHVYSFEKIKLPLGAKLKDASKILNKKEIKRFIHQGKKGCLAAFSDRFRIELQKKNKGWWFDMDVICLKKAYEFAKLENNRQFVIGLETESKVNNAVLKISNSELIMKIDKNIKNTRKNIGWGEIGPNLINSILKKKKYFKDVLPKSYFYPINFKKFKNLLLPKHYNHAKKICSNSFTIHYYNSIFQRFGIPKNILPPKNSFLYEQFIINAPELKKFSSLEENTALRLLEPKNSFKENLKDLIPSLIRSIK